MAIISSKKAVFFSLIAILMSTLFILLFSGASHVALDERAKIAQYDVSYINDFVGDLDQFVDSSSNMATFATLNDLAFQAPISVSAKTAFLSCFENGTFYDGSSNLDCDGNSSINHSFRAVFAQFSSLAKKAYDIDLTLNLINFSFRQVDTYYVETNVSCEINVTHLGASWSRTIFSSQKISIIGVTDPLTVGTSYQRPITLWPGAFAEGQNIAYFHSNYTHLEIFVSGGYYFIDETAPSLLDMLEGNFPVNDSGYKFNSLGIGSFIPDNYTPYPGVHTSYVLYQNASGMTFTSDDLRRINVTGLNTNFSIPLTYIQDVMHAYNGNCPGGVDPEIFNVTTCCNYVSGCNPACGAPPPCSS